MKTPFARFLETVLPFNGGCREQLAELARGPHRPEIAPETATGLVFLLGLYLASCFFSAQEGVCDNLASSAVGGVAHRFTWFSELERELAL